MFLFFSYRTLSIERMFENFFSNLSSFFSKLSPGGKRFAKKVRIIWSLERGHGAIQMELPVAQNFWRALAVVD